MNRISIPWLFGIIQSFEKAGQVKSGKLDFDTWFPLYNARGNLISLYGGGLYSNYLRVSSEAASDFFRTLTKLAPERPDFDTELSEADAFSLQLQSETLLTLLKPELGVLPSFLVNRKEAFDTIMLIESGIALFPPSLNLKVPEAKFDAAEVGKALAFEMATACGFHIFRVLECVLRRYWTTVSGGADHPNVKTIGRYTQELEKIKDKDQRIIESLKQVGSLHRNPLAHPEVILTVEEAVSSLGMVRSLIDAMLRIMPEIEGKSTETTEIAEAVS